MNRFYVQVKGKNQYFKTIEEAKAACEKVFKATGIILGIVEEKTKP